MTIPTTCKIHNKLLFERPYIPYIFDSQALESDKINKI